MTAAAARFGAILLPLLLLSALALLALLEAQLLLQMQLRQPAYCRQESLASLATAIGCFICSYFALQIGVAVLLWLYAHRLFDIRLDHGWQILLLFFGVEFCYYCYHRGSHHIRWFWASHAVHHTTRHLNLSAAYRLGWTSELSGTYLFYAPLVWLGFAPLPVLTMLGLVLLYQFWLHTELIPPLGKFDRLFNTPSNHRVHHSIHADDLQHNFGGVLMIFDHLFGTYAPENAARRAADGTRYGLLQPLQTHNPLHIALHEWRAMWRDATQATGWRNGCRKIFGPP